MKKQFRPSTCYAARLRQARLAAGMTQAVVAEHICIDRTTYNKYEAGRVEPSLQTAYELARLFHVTLDGLLKPE